MTSLSPQAEQISFYEAVGGHPTFEALVDRFYDGVAEDPLLHPMYPEEDLTGARWRLCAFLEQYWVSPTDRWLQPDGMRSWLERHGADAEWNLVLVSGLRMRHAPFPVSPAARDAWLHHMRVALDSLELAPLHEQTLWDYLERAAHSMINTVDGGEAPAAGQTIPDRLS